jgi:nucleoside-diphosphate-sugar epimerase
MLPTVRLIEQCYATAEPLEEPWVTLALPNAPSDTRRASTASGASRPAASQGRMLITGAGGFVGTRLGERLLLGSSWDVRAMVRTPGGISRLARLPVDVTLGDVLDRASLTRALHGCDAVVHAAVGTSWREADRIAVNVEGTLNIVEAALAAGVRRFVHVGSISVYGDDAIGSVDERTPVNPRKGWTTARARHRPNASCSTP